MNDFLNAVGLALLIAPFASLLATIYVVRVFFADPHRPRSRVLFIFVLTCVQIEIASFLLIPVALSRLARDVVHPDVSIPALAIGLILMVMIPPLIAFDIWRTRRTSGR